MFLMWYLFKIEFLMHVFSTIPCLNVKVEISIVSPKQYCTHSTDKHKKHPCVVITLGQKYSNFCFK